MRVYEPTVAVLTVPVTTIFAVKSPSMLSVAVAPESVKVSPTVSCIAAAPVSVTTGAVVSVEVDAACDELVEPSGLPTMTERIAVPTFPAASVAL